MGVFGDRRMRWVLPALDEALLPPGRMINENRTARLIEEAQKIMRDRDRCGRKAVVRAFRCRLRIRRPLVVSKGRESALSAVILPIIAAAAELGLYELHGTIEGLCKEPVIGKLGRPNHVDTDSVIRLIREYTRRLEHVTLTREIQGILCDTTYSSVGLKLTGESKTQMS